MGKTVTEVLKMLPVAAGRGQQFQVRGTSAFGLGPYSRPRARGCLQLTL